MRKNRFVVAPLLAAILATQSGCDPVTVVGAGKLLTFVIGGWAAAEHIESMHLDNVKKRLEIQTLKDGSHASHALQLSEYEVDQLRRSGKVQINDVTYRVR